VTLVLVAVAALAAGCGSDKEGKPIPAQQKAELQKQLDSIEGRFDFGDGACQDIERDNVSAVQRTLDSIPASVDRDVRNALRDSFDRLFELTGSQCEEQKNQKTTPTTPTNTETETTTTETETQTQTETTPTETTPEKPGKGPKKPKEQKGPKGGGGVGVPPGQVGGGAGGDEGD
jgi:hypothetical protein